MMSQSVGANLGHSVAIIPLANFRSTRLDLSTNIFFECGCLESTEYAMCDRAMMEANHTTKQDPSICRNHPCAKCFIKGLAGKANQTRQRKLREARIDRHTANPKCSLSHHHDPYHKGSHPLLRPLYLILFLSHLYPSAVLVAKPPVPTPATIRQFTMCFV